MRRPLWRTGLLVAILVPVLARADVGPPAHMQVTEEDPGRYSVQWRVPKALPARAVPTPLLPESCRPATDPSVLEQADAWFLTREWLCDASLAGEIVGIRYPFPDLSLTTVIRVDLLSGDRFAHVLTPGDPPWRLPEGTAEPDYLRGGQRAMLAGLRHVLGAWIHGAFLLALAMLGGFRRPLWLVTAFTLGQVGGALLTSASGLGIGSVPAEIGFAVAVALAAREALRPSAERLPLAAVVAGAGILHGLGLGALLSAELGAEGGKLAAHLLGIVGMDAAHVAGAAALVALGRAIGRVRVPGMARTGLAYADGAAAMALAIALAGTGAARGKDAVPSASVHAGALQSPVVGAARSQRVAPSTPDAPIQSFLAVEPFEVRHEVLLRLAGLTEWLDLDPAATLEPPDQPLVLERLTDLVLAHATVRVDGGSPEPLVRRADFMTVDPTGALPRPNPVSETVEKAAVGLIVVYPIDGMPGEAGLAWEPFPDPVASIPATVIDPEAVSSAALTPDERSLRWENALREDPVPTVAAVPVEPVRLPVPLLSLPLLALAAGLATGAIRRRRPPLSAAARLTLALAVLVGPLARTAVAVPGSEGRAPSDRQARRILAGLLPNIYRAMEFRDEAVIYDRLAVSVTGETLLDVYLEQRRALELDERGGAQARVETVEVREAREIRSLADGFEVRGLWTVGGMVTHFGHRHFRQSRYDARIGVVSVEGAWKIRTIEVLDQERVR